MDYTKTRFKIVGLIVINWLAAREQTSRVVSQGEVWFEDDSIQYSGPAGRLRLINAIDSLLHWHEKGLVTPA